MDCTRRWARPGSWVSPFVIYLVQIPFSLWWLRRFQFGPLEWLWRSLTYGKRQARGAQRSLIPLGRRQGRCPSSEWPGDRRSAARRTLVFAPETINIAETMPMIEEDFMISTVAAETEWPGPRACTRALAAGAGIKLELEFPTTRWACWGAGRSVLAGDFHRLQVGELQRYFISHPDDIREVLVTQAGKFIKDAQYRGAQTGIARYLGNGLLTSDGEFWRRQRRLVAPAFHSKRIESYAGRWWTTRTEC